MNQNLIVRGVRGASCVKENSVTSIHDSTMELLQAMLEANDIKMEDIVAIYFTLTPDLNAAFPAEAARKLGLKLTPLLCMQEIDVPYSLPKVVRVLMQINTHKSLQEIKHVFLGEAKVLRDDL